MKAFPPLPRDFFDLYEQIGNELRQSNRFTLPPHLAKIAEEYINWHVNHKLIVIEPGTVFTRARINQPKQAAAYSIDDMGAPPKEQAGSGRINPEGISYLYLADTTETAIAEVRPWKGAIVSVAKFEVLHKIRVASLRSKTINNLEGIDTDIEKDVKHIVRNTIASEILNKLYFSTPAHGYDKLAYLPSQYLAEMFKAHEIDGIEYESVLHSGGVNLAIFNPVMARGLSVNLHEVSSVKYISAPMQNHLETTSSQNEPLPQH